MEVAVSALACLQGSHPCQTSQDPLCCAGIVDLCDYSIGVASALHMVYEVGVVYSKISSIVCIILLFLGHETGHPPTPLPASVCSHTVPTGSVSEPTYI